MLKFYGLQDSAMRQVSKPNQLTDVSGVKVTVCNPCKARGLQSERMRVKGAMQQDLNLKLKPKAK
jgi:sulfur relay (sulfurtransferase) complex TusBCD TusD component (DsrE family)